MLRLKLLPDDPDAGETLNYLKRLTRDQGTPKHTKATIFLHLARHKERNGDFEGAFSDYSTANHLGAAHYDPADFVAYVSRLISSFSQIHGQGKYPETLSPSPIFIVGMPRTGTTLVEQILGSHPQVACGGELTTISSLATEFAPSYPNVHPSALEDRRLLEETAERYTQTLRNVSSSSRFVTDKMPHNFLHLGFIRSLFPSATIVHCRRNALDTCLSCFCQPFFTAHPYSTDLRSLGRYYREYDRLIGHWRDTLGIPMLELKYEELVANQKNVTASLLEYCKLEWDDRCLDFSRNAPHATTRSYDQVRLPVYSRSVGRWKRYKKHLGPLIEALGGLADTGS